MLSNKWGTSIVYFSKIFNGDWKICSFFFSPIWHPHLYLHIYDLIDAIKFSIPGSSKAMKHPWYGKCSYTSTYSTPPTGTTAVPCPPSCSSTVHSLPSYIPRSGSGSGSSSTTLFFAFSVSRECTSTTYTPKIDPQNGLQNYTWPPCSSAVFAGFATVCSARKFLNGTWTHKAMLYGTYWWALTRILQTHSWCFVGLNNGVGAQEWCTSWDFSRTWRFKSPRPNEKNWMIKSVKIELVLFRGS